MLWKSLLKNGQKNIMKNEEKKVCVIMPHYNQAEYIIEALESVVSQSYKNLEIVIFDDCSTDKAAKEIINRLAENKFLLNSNIPLKVIKSSKNCGAAHGRNEAIKSCNSEYILPLDSDDRISKTYIEKAVNILNSNKEIGVVYCRAMLFGDVDEEWVLPEFSMPEFLYGNCIFCSALYKKKNWEKVGGYNENLKNEWEDYDLWLKMISNGDKVYRIDEELFFYRQHTTNYTKKYKNNIKEVLNSHKAILQNNLNFYQKYVESIYLKNIENRIAINKNRENISFFNKYYKKKDDLIVYLKENKKEIIDLKLHGLINYLIRRSIEDGNSNSESKNNNDVVIKLASHTTYLSEQIRKVHFDYSQLLEKKEF